MLVYGVAFQKIVSYTCSLFRDWNRNHVGKIFQTPVVLPTRKITWWLPSGWHLQDPEAGKVLDRWMSWKSKKKRKGGEKPQLLQEKLTWWLSMNQPKPTEVHTRAGSGLHLAAPRSGSIHTGELSEVIVLTPVLTNILSQNKILWIVVNIVNEKPYESFRVLEQISIWAIRCAQPGFTEMWSEVWIYLRLS